MESTEETTTYSMKEVNGKKSIRGNELQGVKEEQIVPTGMLLSPSREYILLLVHENIQTVSEIMFQRGLWDARNC